MSPKANHATTQRPKGNQKPSKKTEALPHLCSFAEQVLSIDAACILQPLLSNLAGKGAVQRELVERWGCVAVDFLVVALIGTGHGIGLVASALPIHKLKGLDLARV